MKSLRILATTLCLASLPLAALAADSVGSRLDRMLGLKAQTDLARQENALREELMRAGSVSLPSVVSISGSSATLSARLLLPSGSQRSFSAGDHIGNGWNIVFLKPDEVLVAREPTKGSPIKLVPLAFAQPEVASTVGRVGPPPQFPGQMQVMPAIPPLPPTFPTPPAQNK